MNEAIELETAIDALLNIRAWCKLSSTAAYKINKIETVCDDVLLELDIYLRDKENE